MSRLVAYDEFSYNHEKSIYGVPVPGYRFEKVQRVPVDRFLVRSLRGAASTLYVPLFPVRQSPGRPRTLSQHKPALYHLWNRTPVSRAPWIVTFESYLPRIPKGSNPWVSRWAEDRLASDDCRAIVALSGMACRTFQRDHPQLAASVSSKIQVLHPAQLSFLSKSELDAKLNRGPRLPLRALFVGHDFFRKGGAAVLAAAKELSRTLAPVHFDVVSRVDSGDYLTGATRGEAERATHEMASMPNFTLTKSMSQSQLSSLMADADVLLLPTLDDTFGYVAIEAMARGTPVISTDIRALPEINPPEAGWQLHLERGKLHPEHWEGIDTPAGSSERRDAVEGATHRLALQLTECLTSLAGDELQLRLKIHNSFAHALDHFSPAVHAAKRVAIYDRALDHG